MLDRDPTLLGERLDTGRATELAVTGVLHATEGGRGLIGDALIVDVDDPGPDAAEDARFELARGCPQHAFQQCWPPFTNGRYRPWPARTASGRSPVNGAGRQ